MAAAAAEAANNMYARQVSQQQQQQVGIKSELTCLYLGEVSFVSSLHIYSPQMVYT